MACVQFVVSGGRVCGRMGVFAFFSFFSSVVRFVSFIGSAKKNFSHFLCHEVCFGGSDE